MGFKVFKKELFEMLRDRRVAIGAFVMPALTVLMMFHLLAMIESGVKKQRKETITFVSGGESTSLARSLKQNNIKTVTSLAEGRKLVEKGEAKLVVEVEPEFDSNLQMGRAKVKAVYDSSEPLSKVLLGVFEDQIQREFERFTESKIAALGADPEILRPVTIEPIDVAKDEAKKGGAGLASMIPYLILLWAFYGGMSSVADMVAGEKERGTLETLLISPITRKAIALGKFWSLYLICLASSVCALVGVAIAGFTTRGAESTQANISLSLSSLGSVMVSLFPLVGFFAALLLLVSAWAKNMREAQTYLASVSFVILIPAVFSNMIGFTDLGKSAWIAYTPVLSSAVVIRSALLGKPEWTTALISGSVSLVLAVVLMGVVVRMFHHERILSRI